MHNNQNSTITVEDYFYGVSQTDLQKMITHTYYNNVTEVRERVEKYIGKPIHPDVHDSKVREAYMMIKQPKFIAIHEILKIIK